MTIECIRFKKYESGVLLGFCDLYMPKWGVELRGCSVCTKNNHRWINLPSKEFQDEAGDKKWQNLVHFREKAHSEQFGNAALQAVDKWISENGTEPEAAPQTARITPAQDGLPF